MPTIDNVIFVPTRGRVDQQITLRQLPPTVLSRVIIACHPGEEVELSRQWGSYVLDVIPIKANNIGQVRQQCIDLSSSDYITFVDDSLDFHVRTESEKGRTTKYPLKVMSEIHFTKETLERHMTEMFDWISNRLHSDRYGMVGISRRSSNAYNLEEEVVLNERVCSFWGVNRKLLNQLKGHPKFSDMSLKEDFYITLHFLTNGIPTITSYKYAYGRAGGGANSPGGCSIYRSPAKHEKSAYDLKEHFPNFVTIHNKGTVSWQGFDHKTIDVIVRCKKAFEYGQQQKG
jgi:hypothetical protein